MKGNEDDWKAALVGCVVVRGIGGKFFWFTSLLCSSGCDTTA